MVIGLLTLAAIPTTIGVAQGVSQQRQKNSEDDDKARMAKFYIDAACEGAKKSRRARDVHGRRAVLRDGKVYLDEHLPNLRSKPAYTARAFYIEYPDEEREQTRGLVTKVADDPPMLNWIYVDKNTLELKYGNRTQSREHHVGPWDWTGEEEKDYQHEGVTMEGWEGFVAVEEDPKGPGGGEWAVYFDRKDDGLTGFVDGKKKRMLEIRLIRTMCEDQEL